MAISIGYCSERLEIGSRELTVLGNQWTEAANGYYRLNPMTPDAGRGMTELIGNMEVIRDWDYDNVKLAIQGDANRAITVYKPGFQYHH